MRAGAAELAEVVQVRANVIDWTKCSTENSVAQINAASNVRWGSPKSSAAGQCDKVILAVLPVSCDGTS